MGSAMFYLNLPTGKLFWKTVFPIQNFAGGAHWALDIGIGI